MTGHQGRSKSSLTGALRSFISMNREGFYSYASAFNFVFAPRDGAITECSIWKQVKFGVFDHQGDTMSRSRWNSGRVHHGSILACQIWPWRSTFSSYLSEVASFYLPHLHPPHLAPPLGWLHLNFAEIFGIRKLESLAYRLLHGVRVILRLAVLWQTDTRLRHKLYRASVASRASWSKNWSNLRFIRPAGSTVCNDQGKIRHGRVTHTWVYSCMPKFGHDRRKEWVGSRAPKLKFCQNLWFFDPQRRR